MIKKITTGYVEQIFDTDTGKWVGQKFVAGDCEFEVDGNRVNSDDLWTDEEPYMRFEMVQPEDVEPRTLQSAINAGIEAIGGTTNTEFDNEAQLGFPVVLPFDHRSTD